MLEPINRLVLEDIVEAIHTKDRIINTLTRRYSEYRSKVYDLYVNEWNNCYANTLEHIKKTGDIKQFAYFYIGKAICVGVKTKEILNDMRFTK